MQTTKPQPALLRFDANGMQIGNTWYPLPNAHHIPQQTRDAITRAYNAHELNRTEGAQ